MEPATSTYLLLLYFVLIRMEMRDREINMGDNKAVERILDWEPGDLDLSNLKFKNLQSLKWC